MSHPIDDTIVAIASAPGGAMRGVVRCSGPDAAACLELCFQADDKTNLASHRRAVVLSGGLTVDQPIGSIPCDLYLWPTSRSYTQQPSAEIHTIGSPPILEAIVRTICAHGARLAEPGEFTMRAFLAGRLDLTQAEAVLGVIDAGSRSELDVALTQLAGGLRTPLNQLRDQLVDLLAHLEAGLDFVEEDIEFISSAEIQQQLGRASGEVTRIANQMNERTETTGEYRVVLVGSPNTGKSSLLNALAGSPQAIVSSIAGTTRDYVSCRFEIDGTRFRVMDTAGVSRNPSDHEIELAAQSMTDAQSQQSHLQILCLDNSRPLNEWEKTQLSGPEFENRLVVGTKCDLVSQTNIDQRRGIDDVQTSSQSGTGIDELRQRIVQCLKETQAGQEVVVGTASRCRESLRLAAAAINRAIDLSASHSGEELVAAELRNALDELGRVVGTIYTDDILDRIFSRFCIGK